MQNYNPSGLENIANNNPLKNQKGGIGKKILIAGGIAILVVGSVFAYDQLASNQETSLTPYTPPDITTPAPTDNTTITPTENATQTPTSLEDKLPDNPSLEDISEYTLKAYNMAYDGKISGDNKMRERARELLYDVIGAVAESNFSYEKLWALRKTHLEYLGKLSEDNLIAYEKSTEKLADEWSKNPDKESILKYIRNDFSKYLGLPSGAYK